MERIVLQPPNCLLEKARMTDLFFKAQTEHFFKEDRLKVKKKNPEKRLWAL